MSIAVPAFALALATTFAGTWNGLRGLPGLTAPLQPGAEFGMGLAAGALAPCSTAAVALAAMLRGSWPFAAAGMLASAGILPFPRLFSAPAGPATHGTRLGLALVGVSCGALALLGGRGLVHPRLVPLLWFALPASLIALRRRTLTRTPFALVAPLLMLSTLALGSPVPRTSLPASTLDDAYPGEAIVFLGRAAHLRQRTTLVRYAITCCRADATAIVVPTTIRDRIEDGTWLRVRGTIALGPQGAVVRVSSWQRVRPPADPYEYR